MVMPRKCCATLKEVMTITTMSKFGTSVNPTEVNSCFYTEVNSCFYAGVSAPEMYQRVSSLQERPKYTKETKNDTTMPSKSFSKGRYEHIYSSMRTHI